jgi:hypothetical protein
MNLRHQQYNLRELVAVGCTEYQAALDANIARIDEWRATGVLNRALAANALRHLRVGQCGRPLGVVLRVL